MYFLYAHNRFPIQICQTFVHLSRVGACSSKNSMWVQHIHLLTELGLHIQYFCEYNFLREVLLKAIFNFSAEQTCLNKLVRHKLYKFFSKVLPIEYCITSVHSNLSFKCVVRRLGLPSHLKALHLIRVMSGNSFVLREPWTVLGPKCRIFC